MEERVKIQNKYISNHHTILQSAIMMKIFSKSKIIPYLWMLQSDGGICYVTVVWLPVDDLIMHPLSIYELIKSQHA